MWLVSSSMLAWKIRDPAFSTDDAEMGNQLGNFIAMVNHESTVMVFLSLSKLQWKLLLT
jgi:hypothetical protein